MGLQSDKFTLQGMVQPWRCDLCGVTYEPDLKGICAACGKLICGEHRVPRDNARALGGKDSLCPGCAAAQSLP